MRIEGFFVELNLKRKKMLLCCSMEVVKRYLHTSISPSYLHGCSYNPKFSQISFHLNELGKNLDTLTSKYDNIILSDDFNTEPTDTALSNFCEIYNLKNLIKDKTCLKNPNKPSCNDLIITNRPKSFQNSMVIETRLSDFHKMCITVMKMYHSKQKPFIIHYRKFKDFNNDAFIKDLKTLLSKSFNEETIPFQALRESVNATLEKNAPSRTRYTRANQASYMNQKLSKEIMKRSRLRNKFLNSKSDLDGKAYNKLIRKNY